MGVVDEVVNRQQLHGRDAEVLQVSDIRGMAQASVGTAQLFGNCRVVDGEAAYVDFIDDGVGERDAQSSVAAPVEGRIDDDGFRNARPAVVFVLVQVGIFLAER